MECVSPKSFGLKHIRFNNVYDVLSHLFTYSVISFLAVENVVCGLNKSVGMVIQCLLILIESLFLI